MPLSMGSRLGPYEITAAIGAGGMGEVYRARDTKLGRDVAIKVLPEAFTHDSARMARFSREAKLLAALNHTNIASIYGLEDSGDTRALVMELAEGPTLADRIKQGPIPIEDAIPIARQMADALEYAHEKGIIHRDLKPANVKVSADDTVKILDFGLAKAMESDLSAEDIANSSTLSHLPTQAGVLLGTAAYMSPEQAKAKPVDRRADIWAFGCVLYEMLTGKMPFHGDTVTDTLAAVLKNDPDWSQLPAVTPQHVRVLLRRCLQKDARQRLQAMGDARIALDEVTSGAPEGAPSPGAVMPAWRRTTPWALAAALGIALAMVAMLFVVGYFVRARQVTPATVAEISLPVGARLVPATSLSPAALSPDGHLLAFCALGADGRQLLWVRPLDTANAQPLAETDGAERPFWSPDSRYLGYFANGKLNRIDASGGPPLALCGAVVGVGGSWGPDGTILFADLVTARSTIYRVPAAGGTPQRVITSNESLGPTGAIWPQFLPDGKHFLFLSGGGLGSEPGGINLASVDGGETRLISRNTSNAIYAPPGYLLFVRGGTLMAQRFDAGKLQLAGDAMPVAEQVGTDPFFAATRAFFTVSENGTLAYQGESAARGDAELLWFDRSGKQIGKTGSPGAYGTVSVSPNGSKIAATVAGPSAIWVYDIARDIRTRLTFDSSLHGQPTWSPDGKFIAFYSTRSGLPHLYQSVADGTGSTTPLVVDDGQEQAPSWSSDGRYLFFERLAAQPNSHSEIWALPLFGNPKAFPVVQTQFDVESPALSPDAKWLAYASTESGREEVYVAPFLHGTGKWLVSTNGGNRPRWRRDGKELFYLSLDNKLMAAGIVESGSSLTMGRVQPLFAVNSSPSAAWPYDVSPDGKRFVVVSQGPQQAAEPIMLVTNWPSLLKKR